MKQAALSHEMLVEMVRLMREQEIPAVGEYLLVVPPDRAEELLKDIEMMDEGKPKPVPFHQTLNRWGRR